MQRGIYLVKKLFLGAVLAPFAAVANDSAVLDPVFVTATREAATAAKVVPSTQVITREQIERTQANDVADLLRGIAGVDVARTGGPGAPIGVFIRGAESNHTLFLIDGVRFTTESFLNAQIQNLTPEAIERIEIVKGPRSTQWGSDAIGGVVNIITRRAGKGLTGGASLRGGSFSTREATANVGYGGEKGSAMLSVQGQRIGGFPPLQTGINDRGQEDTNIHFNGDLKLGPVELGARHLQAQGINEYVQFGAEKTQDFRNRVSAVDIGTSLGGGWSTKLTASLAYDEIVQREPGDPARPTLVDSTEVERTSFEWNTSGKLLGTDLLVGLSTSKSEIDSVFFSGFGDGATIDNTTRNAAFIQAQHDFGVVDVLLAVRQTDHDEFGSFTTGNVEAGIEAWEGGRIGVALGTAFKEPELTDLFGAFGNPDLDPERSKSAELNLRQRIGANQTVTAAAFETRIDDLIAFSGASLENVQRARIRGIEAGWQYQGEALSAEISGSLQDPKDETTGNRLARRSGKSIQSRLGYRIGDVNAGVEVQGYGRRRDANGVDLAGYALVNADLRVALTKNLSLSLRGENLFDETYELVDTYRTPERSGYITVRYTY